MEAWLAGLLSAFLFGAVVLLLAFALRRVSWRPSIRASAVAIASVGLAVLVPPPLVLAGRAGYVTILGGGHAGQAFLGPYFAVALIFVIIASWIAARSF